MQGVTTILSVVGSVGLLLWGVRMVRTGLTRAFGATLRRAIAACSRNRFTAFAGGVGLTGLLQSSTATALLLASFAGRGLITLPIAIAVMLGANVGTTLTSQVLSFDLSWLSPLMIAIGVVAFLSSEADKARHLGRVAIGLGLMLLSLKLLSAATDPLRSSPSFLAALDGMQDQDAIAVLFGLVGAMVCLPALAPLGALRRRPLVDRRAAEAPAKPHHLDPHVLDTPAEALACAMRETLYLGDRVGDMLRQTMDVFERNDEKGMRAIANADNTIDHLYEAIKLYLVQISRSELCEEEGRRYIEILSFTTNLEHIGDIIDKNLMELAAKKIKNRWVFSAEGMAELKAFHARVMENLRLSMNVFTTRDLPLARRLVAEKTVMREIEGKAADSHFARLREGRPESMETSSIHIDVIRDLKRINGHLTSAAYPILEAAGELADTRLKEAQPLMRAPAGS